MLKCYLGIANHMPFHWWGDPCSNSHGLLLLFSVVCVLKNAMLLSIGSNINSNLELLIHVNDFTCKLESWNWKLKLFFCKAQFCPLIDTIYCFFLSSSFFSSLYAYQCTLSTVLFHLQCSLLSTSNFLLVNHWNNGLHILSHSHVWS